MEINQNFDGGNIQCLDCSQADNIRLSIEQDAQSKHRQWFYFSLSGAKHRDCRLVIENAAKTSFPFRWIVSAHSLATLNSCFPLILPNLKKLQKNCRLFCSFTIREVKEEIFTTHE